MHASPGGGTAAGVGPPQQRRRLDPSRPGGMPPGGPTRLFPFRRLPRPRGVGCVVAPRTPGWPRCWILTVLPVLLQEGLRCASRLVRGGARQPPCCGGPAFPQRRRRRRYHGGHRPLSLPGKPHQRCTRAGAVPPPPLTAAAPEWTPTWRRGVHATPLPPRRGHRLRTKKTKGDGRAPHDVNALSAVGPPRHRRCAAVPLPPPLYRRRRRCRRCRRTHVTADGQ